VDVDHYAYVGLQWSRGCPFNCEFCDIIELFGRVPRLKRVDQVLAELDNLYRLGWRGAVDIVDDNFIGNQREVAVLLGAMREWQEAHGWPFEFGTEVSLNLADRPQLLELMRAAGFCAVFTGIETPDDDALRRINKLQNTKRDLRRSVSILHRSGMMVMAGYILGIDGEGPDAADRIIDLIQRSAVPVDMVGLLFALPSTQLARRLASEGRLPADFEVVSSVMGGDQCSEGLNFETLRPKSGILRDYVRILRAIYAPKPYFDRVLRMALELGHRGRKLSLGGRGQLKDAMTFLRMCWSVGLRRRWGWRWWKLLAQVLARNPRSIRYALWMATLYVHFSEFTPALIERIEGRAEALERAASYTDGTPRVPDSTTR
jgi:hypothetical protein